MTGQLTLVLGRRHSGKTTKLIELMAETLERRRGRGLLLVPNYAACDATDILIIRLGLETTIVTKPWARVRDAWLGETWEIVGVDGILPGGPVPIEQDVEFQTVTTTTDLTVVEVAA